MHLSSLLLTAGLTTRTCVQAERPDKIYGVNLGSWLLVEPWMLPNEWTSMGGQDCANCEDCIRSEFDLVKADPQGADQKFAKHWESWFNQADVDELVSLGINTVRIPEHRILSPRGLQQLRRGLSQLKAANIQVILDHHGAPGVQTPNQMFTGRCTADVQFYTPKNYQRALTWTAIMTTLSHLDPEFSTVFALEAVNEPIMDANMTPGFGDFQKQFALTVRLVESILGIFKFPPAFPQINIGNTNSDISTAFGNVASDSSLQSKFPEPVLQALKEAGGIIQQLQGGGGNGLQLGNSNGNREALTTNFMDINWQFNNPPNPADAAIGPAGYDNHLYYSFGGVADANEEAYLKSVCNLDRIQKDNDQQNNPLWFGEWGLPTEFAASDEFLKKFADAQKLAFGKSGGWIFWNFKLEGDGARQWSYTEGVRRGYFTKDPSQFNDPNVCDPYINK